MQPGREFVGILIVGAVSICFALSNTLAGLAYTGGADPLSVSTVRYFLPALILLVVLGSTGKPVRLPRRDALIACVLGFVTAIYSWSMLAAIEIMPLPLAVLIFFLFPLITSFIVVLMGWEKPRLTMIVAAIVAFLGLALALGVGGATLNPVGIALAAVGALGLATVSVVSSRVIRAGDARQVTLHIVGTTALIFLAITLLRGEFPLPNGDAAWWGFVANNFLFAAAIIGYFKGIEMIGPVRTTVFSYIEPVAAAAAAFLILGQQLAPLQLVGLLIVTGALIAAARRPASERR